MPGSRKDGSELAAHQRGTENASEHGSLPRLTREPEQDQVCTLVWRSRAPKESCCNRVFLVRECGPFIVAPIGRSSCRNGRISGVTPEAPSLRRCQDRRRSFDAHTLATSR